MDTHRARPFPWGLLLATVLILGIIGGAAVIAYSPVVRNGLFNTVPSPPPPPPPSGRIENAPAPDNSVTTSPRASEGAATP